MYLRYFCFLINQEGFYMYFIWFHVVCESPKQKLVHLALTLTLIGSRYLYGAYIAGLSSLEGGHYWDTTFPRAMICMLLVSGTDVPSVNISGG